MKIGTILKAIHKHAAIHECSAVFFAFCWFIHFAASLKMQMRSHFASMDDETLRDMALIDWVAAHSWMAIAYVLLAVVRRHSYKSVVGPRGPAGSLPFCTASRVSCTGCLACTFRVNCLGDDRNVLHHGGRGSRWPDPRGLLDGLRRGHRRGAIPGQDILRQAEADFREVDC